MTQTSNRILDEFARLMTDAAGVARGVREEAEVVFRTQAEKALRELDVVQREEFEAVREMASRAREENERLAERITELEGKLAEATKTSGGRAQAKKTTRQSRSAKGGSDGKSTDK